MFRNIAILAIAGLAVACSAPLSQSTNPATVPSAAISNGHASPDGPCNYVKMEPPMKNIRVNQQLGIAGFLRLKSSGKCESFWLSGNWSTSGGKIVLRKQGKMVIFSATMPGTYYVTDQVYYGSYYSYTGQSTITVNP